MTIEERIQDLRKTKGLSQEQLAEILGVSRQAVSKWEGGQSLPEIEKLISMSELFEVSIDYILKGEMPPSSETPATSFKPSRFASQIVSAVAAMLFATGIIACFSNGDITMDIYGGLIIESAGIMLLLIGWFLRGNHVVNKSLFIANILLAGVLPSSFLSQTLLGLKPAPLPPPAPLPVLLFAGIDAVICGTVIYFAMYRKKG